MENDRVFNNLSFFINLHIKMFFIDTDKRKINDGICLFCGLIESIVNCLLYFIVLNFFEGTNENTDYASNDWVLKF